MNSIDPDVELEQIEKYLADVTQDELWKIIEAYMDTGYIHIPECLTRLVTSEFKPKDLPTRYLLKNEELAPDWMFNNFDPEYKNKSGMTYAMTWVKYESEDVPENVRHNSKILNNKGYDIAMLCVKYRNQPPPQWMIESRKNVVSIDGRRKTLKSLWRKYIGSPYPYLSKTELERKLSHIESELESIVNDFQLSKCYTDRIAKILDYCDSRDK